MSCYTLEISDCDNQTLKADPYLWDGEELNNELERVASVIHANSNTGLDLEYWFDREQILDYLLDYC